MCQGPRGLAIVVTFMCLGFVAVVVGTFLPFWLEGGGLNIGLFYQCQDLHCERLPSIKNILYVIDALMMFGIVVSGFSLGFAVFLCLERCKGETLPSYVPVCLPLFMMVASFLNLLGAIVYCTAIYDDDDSDYSLDFSPWLVITGAAVTCISCLFLPRTLKDSLARVEPSEIEDPSWDKKQKASGDHYDSKEYRQQQFDRRKYFEDSDLKQHQQKQQQQQQYDGHNGLKHHQKQRQQQQQQDEEKEYSTSSETESPVGQLRQSLEFPEPRSYPYHDPDPNYPPPPNRVKV